MSKLRNRARNANRLFAPLVFRLALRLEQIQWSELQQSASEIVFVTRSAQKLFKLDAVCPNFDTWLELEAAGVAVPRDDLGVVGENPGFPQSLPAPNAYAKTDVIGHATEVIRRLADDWPSAALPLAAVTFGSTLMKRLYGSLRADAILDSMRAGTVDREDNEAIEYIREATLEIATAYLEAGAAGLLLLHEDNAPNLVELPAFAALFNLATYYDVPAIVMCRKPVSAEGLVTLGHVAPDFYLTPSEQSSNVTALPGTPTDTSLNGSGWLGLSRWETDTSTDPDLIHNLRRTLIDA